MLPVIVLFETTAEPLAPTLPVMMLFEIIDEAPAEITPLMMFLLIFTELATTSMVVESMIAFSIMLPDPVCSLYSSLIAVKVILLSGEEVPPTPFM